MPTLYVLQGPDKGRTLQTHDDVVLIGRGSDQVPLTDRTVSRRHAELRLQDGAWYIADLHSANGTYLNGVRVQEPVRLKHGDQIRMGSTLLVYAGDASLQQLSGPNIPADLVRLDAGSTADASVVASVSSSEDSVVMAAPDTAYAVKSWKAIRELTDVIGSLITPEQLLPRVLDILFEQLETDRGVIFMHDDETRELLPEVVRFHSRESRKKAGGQGIVAPRTILDQVVSSREGVLCSNVSSDQRFRAGRSVQGLGMRSVICAPILAREKVLGVIYLDVPVTRHTYNEHELRLVTAIAYQTGLALENARLVQAHLERERLAAAGEAIAYLSHSIKNILQGMRAGGDLVKRGLDRRDFALTTQGWRILERNLDKCYALMLNMLAFSKPHEPHLEMYMVNRLAEDVVQLAQSPADEAGVVLLTDLDESVPPVPLDYDGLHQALLNIVLNAIEAVPRETGVVNVRTGYDPAAGRVTITVADNGPGIPEDQREKIFQPFFSTKGHGGTGLGLAVARKIVEEHGGALRLRCPDDGGAEFTISLPTAEAHTRSPADTRGPRTR